MTGPVTGPGHSSNENKAQIPMNRVTSDHLKSSRLECIAHRLISFNLRSDSSVENSSGENSPVKSFEFVLIHGNY